MKTKHNETGNRGTPSRKATPADETENRGTPSRKATPETSNFEKDLSKEQMVEGKPNNAKSEPSC